MSKFPNFQISKFPNFQISKFPNFQISKFLKGFFIILFVTSSFYACKTKNETITPVNQQKIAQKNAIPPTITSKNGYLAFINTESMHNFVDSVKKMSDEDRISWEKSMNFESMHRIFYKGLEAEEIYSDSLFELNQMAQNHSDYVKSYPNVFYQENDTSGLAMNIFLGEMAMLVNKDGIVKIGPYFFQYTRDYYKMLQSTDESKIGLLMQTTENDTQNNIKVQQINNRQKSFDYFNQCYGSGQGALTNSGLYPACSICSFNFIRPRQFGYYSGIARVTSYTEWNIGTEMYYDCNPIYPPLMSSGCWIFVVVVRDIQKTAFNAELRSDRRCCCLNICARQALRTKKIITFNGFIAGQPYTYYQEWGFFSIAYVNVTIYNGNRANVEGELKLVLQQETRIGGSFPDGVYSAQCVFNIP
ncbi:MAG: DUF4848 domain-containing protein [Cytophagia bacterium]|nr:MAG: DUF4848 domain-containing protein [Cytophagia bacterium]